MGHASSVLTNPRGNRKAILEAMTVSQARDGVAQTKVLTMEEVHGQILDFLNIYIYLAVQSLGCGIWNLVS